jgi:hypothetical protein
MHLFEIIALTFAGGIALLVIAVCIAVVLENSDQKGGFL